MVISFFRQAIGYDFSYLIVVEVDWVFWACYGYGDKYEFHMDITFYNRCILATTYVKSFYVTYVEVTNARGWHLLVPAFPLVCRITRQAACHIRIQHTLQLLCFLLKQCYACWFHLLDIHSGCIGGLYILRMCNLLMHLIWLSGNEAVKL